MVILFLIALISSGVYLVRFARLLQNIVDYSSENNIPIFNANYKNLYHLYADFSFMNTLWMKDCHKQITDAQHCCPVNFHIKFI